MWDVESEKLQFLKIAGFEKSMWDVGCGMWDPTSHMP